MRKIIVSAVATLATTMALATPARAAEPSPAVVLTTCATAYATMAVFASPSSQAALKERSMRIMSVALDYNPDAAKVGLRLLEQNVARVRANDPNIVNEIVGTEQYCRGYLPRFGIN